MIYYASGGGLMKKRLLIPVVMLFVMLFGVSAWADYEWTILDYPGSYATSAKGMNGSNIVGYYVDASGHFQSFLYDGFAWTTLSYPGAINTYAEGISDSNIVGYYELASSEHSFLYNGSTWTTLDYPGAFVTYARGISGSNIVGTYWSYRQNYTIAISGFLYNGSTWTTLNYPGAYNTYAEGISGSKIVGSYQDSLYNYHSFLYDGSTWTTLDNPDAIQTLATGISGNNIVGSCQDAIGVHICFYDGSKWKSFDYGLNYTFAQGISGSNIVGYYDDTGGVEHGFIATPTTVFTPNGGEKIAAGSAYQITWGAPVTAVKFTLQYSINGGTAWKTIATNVTGNSYNWSIPAQTTNKPNCLVKVTGYNSSGVQVGYDQSDAKFTIYAINLTSPNGGESWISKTIHVINWTTGTPLKPIAKVKLYYKYDGTGYHLITSFAGSNPGTYNWTVPTVTAKKIACRIKVELVYTGITAKGDDVSDTNFTILP